MSIRSSPVRTTRFHAFPPAAGVVAGPQVHRDLSACLCARRTEWPRVADRNGGRGAAVAARLASAVQFRDGETGAHLIRVGLYAEALARQLGWGDEVWFGDLRVAAAIHDVGKLAVPDRVLLKPGSLTAEESAVMRRHTEIGAAIIGDSDLPVLRLGQAIALHHHERWDGTGYPHGLAGEAIPHAARVVAVADVYDSLVHNRVYRPPLEEEEALDLMAGRSGSHFDPRVFAGFVDQLAAVRRIRGELRDEATALN